jgi:D-sedoheptulose 7-phosphate isomerase
MSVLASAIRDAQATLDSLRIVEPTLERAAIAIGEALIAGGKLLVAGNGGSAADGADFATEFSCRFITDRRPYPAINLAACGSLITATANDYGTDQMFSRPVRAFGVKGDVLLAITTSGNSANIIAALREANQLGLTTIALLGRDGGKARGIAGIEMLVPGHATARIQEGHKFLLHVLCEMIEDRYLLPAEPAPQPGA